MLRHYRFLIAFITVAILLSSYLLDQVTFDPFDRQWLREVKSGPEYVMQNTITIQYNDQGLERFRMLAGQLSQSSYSETVDLLNPEIVLQPKVALQNEPHQTWRIRADRGQILSSKDESQQLLLQQNVTISNEKPNNDGFSLNTSELKIFPEKKLAQSSKSVLIRSKGADTRAIGLHFDFDHGVVKLKSQVQTTIRQVSKQAP